MPLGRQQIWLPTYELFGGHVGFSRNLVLVDARLVEPDRVKLSKLDRTISLGRRDLRLAALSAADLTKADLTDANLSDANLSGANLTRVGRTTFGPRPCRAPRCAGSPRQ